MFTFSWNLSHFLFQSGHVANWQSDYLQVKFSEFLSNLTFGQGTGFEMYTETLSPTFMGMTFAQTAEWVQKFHSRMVFKTIL